MEKSITPNKIKQNNRSLIYRYIYENSPVSQQDISYHLQLSRPTVTSNLTALEHEGLIQKIGLIETEFVGRKAAAYAIVSDFRVGIGVEILNQKVKIIAVNLYGQKIERRVVDLMYENTDAYYQAVCEQILDFKNTLGISEQQLLGIGFAMQALISPDQQTVVYGKILSCTGLSITAFTKYLPYPCTFIHDADSAAISELWLSPELKDAFYLSISTHLGAAMISDGKILSGKHGHNATIEHIQMQTDGKTCYCGKKGCAETLCSLSALLNEQETLRDFFLHVRSQEVPYVARWEQFLTHLAQVINFVHLIFDTDFILGGYLAAYLCETDIAFLHQKIQQLTPFTEQSNFLRISKMPKHNISIGAALPYIQMFFSQMQI